MIGSLRGRIIDVVANGQVLIEVAGTGIGYAVTVSPSTAGSLTSGSDEQFLWIYHHIREDNQSLFGFLSKSERESFVALLGAHGVGPALALAILSVHQPAALAHVVATEDVDALCLVPGVGNKTAARLLIELKSRLEVESITAPTSLSRNSGLISDLRDALEGLGYRGDEITLALQSEAVRSADNAEAGLRAALKALGKGHEQ